MCTCSRKLKIIHTTCAQPSPVFISCASAPASVNTERAPAMVMPTVSLTKRLHSKVRFKYRLRINGLESMTKDFYQAGWKTAGQFGLCAGKNLTEISNKDLKTAIASKLFQE